MKVSATERFVIIYSIFSHQYLGTLFESFAIQLGQNDNLTFQHQNISHKNADEFAAGMDENDYKLIRLMDSIQQDSIVKKFYNKKITPAEFFLKVFNPEKGDKILQETITNYIESRKSEILKLLDGKRVFVMGKDGEPAWKEVFLPKEKATVLFHFRKNEENTHYFPTIKHEGQKVEFQYNDSEIICNEPAWLLTNEKLFTFKKEVDGKKLKPFLNKKFIVIPKKLEETYYKNFISNLVANFDVYAKGFDIITEETHPSVALTFSELGTSTALTLFDDNKTKSQEDEGKIVFDLSFKYGDYQFGADSNRSVSVKMEKTGDNYIFHRVKRDIDWEKDKVLQLKALGLEIRNGKAVKEKSLAFPWIKEHEKALAALGIITKQNVKDDRRYFLGTYSIDVQVTEKNDWFDIYAVVKFGEFEIPFIKLRNLILKKKREFNLPNGEIAVIPEEWIQQYAELFAFSEEDDEDNFTLKKHHLALVHELQSENLAKVTMDKKLEKLRDFEKIDDFPLPKGFKGELRSYQKAGYNWLQFLNQYNFGGCLADDMGLGKTVQTLTMLLDQKEKGVVNASLLVMPTSLIYNWEMEAEKFAPDLKVFVYTGTGRIKDVSTFEGYDIILTSYGITRLDSEIFQEYYFNYIILDESQAIKNPNSNIAHAVKSLTSKHKLILTGTPIENSTMDLWSQMTFVNPGLLGEQAFFKNEFLKPIEKLHDEEKSKKLYTIIKPFILRRKKNQVVKELPEKIEQIRYCTMTEEQKKKYEEVKSYYRNQILEQIDKDGKNKSQFLLLQGLTKLRQICNHPRMVDEDYEFDSGKMDEVREMLTNAINTNHKILVFSQFVKHLNIVKEYLDSQNLDYAYLDGATKARKSQVELFQNNEDIRIFLISLKAGGVGLNLTAADYVFILDPWWNPAIEAQAVDRAHRIGQKNKVFTYKFITKDSVEEKIVKLQSSKKKLADDLITTEESFVKSLSTEDITALLQ